MGRRGYAPEFREEAVRLWRVSGRSLREVASDLGLSPETIRRWASQIDVDEGRRQGVTSEEREELRRLRRENARLREEGEILKKAGDFLRPGDRSTEMTFRLIEAERAQHSVSRLCSVPGCDPRRVLCLE